MKVPESNLQPLAPASAKKPQETGRAGQSARPEQTQSTSTPDDVHLSGLVRKLQSLAADSPEHQAKIEALSRSYADGSYQVDPQATAAAVIQDSLKP